MCSQLYVDCGFARVAIYELSNQGERGNAAPTVNREERAKEFQSLYSTVANFGINLQLLQPTWVLSITV